MKRSHELGSGGRGRGAPSQACAFMVFAGWHATSRSEARVARDVVGYICSLVNTAVITLQDGADRSYMEIIWLRQASMVKKTNERNIPRTSVEIMWCCTVHPSFEATSMTSSMSLLCRAKWNFQMRLQLSFRKQNKRETS